MELYRSPGLSGEGAGALPPATPPVVRSSLSARPWGRLSFVRWLFRRDAPPRPSHPEAEASGRRRRLLLLVLSLAPAAYATYLMIGILPNEADSALEKTLLALFAVLSCWVAAGFWTAMMGFWVLFRGGDRYLISRSLADDVGMPQARTAVVMPICNEDVARVFAGLRATIESVAAQRGLAHFDFFVLSDSADPDVCVAEVDAWNALRDELSSTGMAELRLFYRRRQRRSKRKSGNIEDFCRRWGASYRYMVVVDADSVMSGECLTTLVRLMEARPDAGIIQTAPRAIGRDTLHARIQQFGNAVYGPVFTAGLHYWQLGESHYWGHNAIIRLEPFMRHCMLPRLPGDGALAGDILSHDFVEAALMRRAGYGVWIAYDLHGSYEEVPPNFLEEVKRDRRWCHGNLMNARLMFASGLHPVHRSVFLTGALAYLAAPLWLGFLVLSSVLLLTHSASEPEYFAAPYQLFPLWPAFKPEHALALFAAVVALLFLPKLLAGILAGAVRPTAFGGRWRLASSLLIEIVASALLAPVRMLFHTQFVLAALSGWKLQWRSPPRSDQSTSWSEALRRHGWQTIVGAAWVYATWRLAPHFLPWFVPVAAGMLLAVPLSVTTSRADLGRTLRRWGLLLTPCETAPSAEVDALAQHSGRSRISPGFVEAVTDPEVHAAVCSTAHWRGEGASVLRGECLERALHQGPDALSVSEKLMLLSDAAALGHLHRAVRTAPVHPSWYRAATPSDRATVHRLAAPADAARPLRTFGTIAR